MDFGALLETMALTAGIKVSSENKKVLSGLEILTSRLHEEVPLKFSPSSSALRVPQNTTVVFLLPRCARRRGPPPTTATPRSVMNSRRASPKAQVGRQ